VQAVVSTLEDPFGMTMKIADKKKITRSNKNMFYVSCLFEKDSIRKKVGES
jgi:hypothetical protein